MNRLIFGTALLMHGGAFLASVPACAAQETVQGELVSVSRVTKELGWTFHLSESGDLLILCQETDAGICVPLMLDEVAHDSRDGELFVDAAALASAVNADIKQTPAGIRLIPRDAALRENEQQSLYHADWGTGRGFQKGQTLPDIPLFDLDGKEVRFSKFLGKQYIIYCWASW